MRSVAKRLPSLHAANMPAEVHAVTAAFPQLLASILLPPGELNITASSSRGFLTRGNCTQRAGSAVPSTCQETPGPVPSWAVLSGASTPASASSASLQPIARGCVGGSPCSGTTTQGAFRSFRSVVGPALLGGGSSDIRRLFSTGGASNNQAVSEGRPRHAGGAVEGDQESHAARLAEPAEVEYLADHDGVGADATSDEAAAGELLSRRS